MKTAVVTGASQGLGQVIAKTFVDAGWRVIGTGRSPRPAALEASIEYEQFDAADAEASAAFWQRLAVDADGTLCLVNNAGGYIGGPLAEANPRDYVSQMQSNYFTGVFMTQGLVRTEHPARIVNIISNNALVISPGSSAYGASKAAAKQFFKTLQKELPAERYRITNLYPDNINSDGSNPQAINPQDLAALIVELASAQTSYYPPDMTLFATPG